MQTSSFFGRFKVGARIYTGFLLILLLLCLVAGMGYRSMIDLDVAFKRYALISDVSIKIKDIDGEVAQMRRNVLNFTYTGDSKALEAARSYASNIDKALGETIAVTTDSERRANQEKMRVVLKSYGEHLNALVSVRDAREKALEEVVNTIGQRVRLTLTAIIDGSMRDGDMESAAVAGLVQQDLMLARLNATRFAGSGDTKLVDAARGQMDDVKKRLAVLVDRLRDPERVRATREAIDGGTRFADGFAALVTATKAANDLVVNVLAGEGAAFGDLASKTVELQTIARDALAKTVDDTTIASERTNIILAVVSLLIGLILALVVARSIVRPVVAMTETMTKLAGGDLSVDVPATGDKDEVGEMARAVLVFKDNAVEKKRMDAAEAARLEAERRADEAKRERERVIGEEIAGLIDSVSRGDLTRRIDLAGKDGFYRTMSEGINRLTDTVEAVIADLADVLSGLAQGDLNKRVARDYQGAFQRVKDDVNATSVKLSEIVGQITQAAETIAAAASEVSTGSTDLSDRTEQQASSLEETAASMEELGATVRSNADNAQRANKMADDARKAAENGGTVAGSAVSAMKRIEEASRKITDIIGVIDEIAFQTNLLALNAAVEAARAGDAGRGFAVVAQEVRNLAQRSAQASKEIKALILDSDGQVREGVDLVKKAGGALEGIVSGVREVASLISDMASASTEQATALDEINATVAQMDEMTQKNAALVEETTAAAQAMAGQAADLKDLIGFFSLDQGAEAGRRPSAHSARPVHVSAVSSARAAPARVVKPVGHQPRKVGASGSAPAGKHPVGSRPESSGDTQAGALKRVTDVKDEDWTEF